MEYAKVQYPGDMRYHIVLRMVYFDRIVGLRDGVPICSSKLQTEAPLDKNDPISHYDRVRSRFSRSLYMSKIINVHHQRSSSRVIINGQSSMVNHQWSIINGQSSMVNNQLSIINGQSAGIPAECHTPEYHIELNLIMELVKGVWY